MIYILYRARVSVLKRGVFLILGILAFLSAQCSDDVKKTSFQIAIIDMKHIASKCKAGISIDDQLCKINDHSKKEYSDLEKKIKEFENKNKKNDTDSRMLEDMQVMLFDAVRKKKYQIETAYQNAISKLEQTIKTVVSEIAIRRGIKLVLLNDVLIHHSEEVLDITDEVIKNVDHLCSFIEVEIKNSEN